MLGGGTKKRQQEDFAAARRLWQKIPAIQTTGDLRIMPLTRNFKETIQERIKSDPVFREELLKEGIKCPSTE